MTVLFEFNSDSDLQSVSAASDAKSIFAEFGVESEIQKDPRSQGLTATLAIILSSSVAVEIAKGIAICFRKHRVSSVTVTMGKTTVKIENITENSAKQIHEKIMELV